MFGVVGAAIVRVIRSRRLRGETRALLVGLATAWVTFLFLLMTAVWLLFVEVQVVFWLYAATFAVQRENHIPVEPARRRWRTGAALAAILVVGAVQLGLGLGSLSLERRRAALGFDIRTGFHALEIDQTGRRFQWTREKEVSVIVPAEREEIRLEVNTYHPKIAQRPFVFWTSLDGQTPVRHELASSGWKWFRLEVPEGTPHPARLTIRVEDTWRPSDHNPSSAEDRELGIQVGRIVNVDADTPLPP
jgi:hypothetical protein